MLKFTENFSITFAENRTYGVPEFSGTEVNRHSGKLKGLSGYLQNHHDTMVGDKTQQLLPFTRGTSIYLLAMKPYPDSPFFLLPKTTWLQRMVQLRSACRSSLYNSV